MTNAVAIPNTFELNNRGHIVTLILPATQCNLKCSWCFIEGRGEVENTDPFLSPDDYLSFLKSFKEKSENIDLIALQGYEALLEESWQYTTTILEFAKQHHIPSSIVTNGTHLKQRAAYLSTSHLKCLIVSLDASYASAHDQTRGVKGAFQQTLSGIQEALKYPQLSEILSVSSVIQPGRLDDLMDMPKLLKQLGIKRWILNPLQNVGEKHFGEVVGSTSLAQNIITLSQRAKAYGITCVVDDEFKKKPIQHLSKYAFIRHIGNPERIVRLSPNGQLSKGDRILSQEFDFHWSPLQQSADHFVHQVL